MKLLAFLVVYAAALLAAFHAAPWPTSAVLELAGIALTARLGWLLHTYAGRGRDPFASRKESR